MNYVKYVHALIILFFASANTFADDFDHSIAIDQARLKSNFKELKRPGTNKLIFRDQPLQEDKSGPGSTGDADVSESKVHEGTLNQEMSADVGSLLTDEGLKLEKKGSTATTFRDGTCSDSDKAVKGQIKDVSEINRYSINLMWINRRKKPSQKYLSSAQDEEELKNHLLSPVIKWATANPKAEVNLWYDSRYVTPAAVENTANVLQKELESKNVRLRDVRGIPIVRDNPDAFSDQVPLYYLVDMYKLIFIVYSIENEGHDAAIFTDLEVGDRRPQQDRMGKDELFNPSVMKNLEEYGFLTNAGLPAPAENQFLQLINNRRMISAIKHAGINVNLLRAASALNLKWREYLLPGLARAVFKSTVEEVFDFYRGTTPGSFIKVRPDIVGRGKDTDEWIDYVPEEHGYAPLGTAFNTRGGEPFVWTPDLDPRSKVIPAKHVIRFPCTIDLPPRRNVDVRSGSDHLPLLSELEYQPPESGDTYCVKLWE